MPTSQQEAGSDQRAAGDKTRLVPPTVSLPKGGGAIRGIGEKFAANPVTGTGSMTVPIATSPGRSGFGPQLSLSYDSGSGNGPFGFGWSLSLPSITRKTDKGLPQYRDSEESDVFILSGAEDLVPTLVKSEGQWVREKVPPRTVENRTYNIQRYRLRIEGLFARIERWTEIKTGETHWRSITRDNVTTLYGKDNNSRIFDPADPVPDHPTRIFSWLICQSYDDKGNALVYQYAEENDDNIDRAQANERNRVRTANRYLKRIKYGNRTPNRDSGWLATDPAQLPDETWMFEVVFDYGEGHQTELALDPNLSEREQHRYVRATRSTTRAWPIRQDPFSNYRSGFEIRTYRLCRRVLMFHRFPQELGIDHCLVRSTEFSYSQSPIASFITSVTQSGYIRQPIQDQPNRYLKKSLPRLEFEYSQVPTPEQLSRQPIREVDSESLENLPAGLDGASYQWMDLDGEGTSGILTEQADGWYYKRNLSANNQVRQDRQESTVVQFGATELVARKPAGGLNGGAQFLDLAGDGQADLVQMEGSVRGFYERTDDANWSPFQPFTSWPDLNTRDPDLKFADLTGDGHADILITEGEAVTWYPSLGEAGFGPAVRVGLPSDEEKGPRLVFADGTQSIYLADLSGDGLSDLVRIRNGEVCYWPNLGYGHFDAKVTMDDAPWFDSPDQFDQRRIRLADTDGSGTTDILYLRRDGVQIYFNQGGNRWSDPVALPQFPPIDNISSVQALDLLGNGTACLVWSSPLPGAARQPMRYLALIDEKPHLLVGMKNNLGAETRVHYAPSTKFYLDDKHKGKPWVTRLPFPVHVIERVETYDWISRNRFVTRYTYHHGYFDGEEREFRGFGKVEQWDTEAFDVLGNSDTIGDATNLNAESHVPPIRTVIWFHTGAYIGGERISRQFEDEYYGAPNEADADFAKKWRDFEATLLPDTLTPKDILFIDGSRIAWSIDADELREVVRALKGSILRQEIYAEDSSVKSLHPYTVSERNYAIEFLQPRGANNRHAVFFVHPCETIDYHYERSPADPRIQHALTLEVDGLGNVLRSATIGYGRREKVLITDEQGKVKEIPNPELNQLDPKDQVKQTTTLITYTENRVARDPITYVIDTADDYRAPLPCETRTYEFTGFEPGNNAARFSFDEWTHDGFGLPASATEIPYEQPADGSTKQKRLIEHVRTLYRKNDLTDLLPLEQLASLALPGASYRLAFTPGLLDQVFRRKHPGQPDEDLLPDPALLLEGKGLDRGGYRDLDGNGRWWIPSGRSFFDPEANVTDPALTAALELTAAHQHFYLPRKIADPFDHSTVVDYDIHDLLVTRTSDELGNTITAANDYRVLQPKLVTDPNRNRAAADFDALALVVATAVMGKEGENLGDLLEDFDANLPLASLQAFIADPQSRAASLLGKATTRVVYDFERYQRAGQPPFAASLARETHFHDPGGAQTKIQVSFSYSDGFGREIQKKIQAEAGDAPQRKPDVLLPEGDIRPGDLMRDNQGDPVQAATQHRWVGSGRTVFNNKGKPVRQYEPFFSATHLYEPERDMTDTGVSPVLFYDPVERVVITLHPNHTYEKVVFDPWQQTTYDVNDTVAANVTETGDPRTDADIQGYVAEYFKTQPNTWQTWHQQRITGAKGTQERSAAEKAARHANTPTTAHFDTLGRTFLTIAHNRFDREKPGGVIEKVEEMYPTRVLLDIEGNQREVMDAKDRVVMRYDYDMLGNRIHQASMEAGERWVLNDVMGKPIRGWDSRGFIREMTYDALRRPTGLHVTANGDKRLAEKTIYGESEGDTENHKTRVYRVFDGAGVVTSESYDFKGNLLQSKRELLPDYRNDVDWNQNPDPNDGTFASSTKYDALNRPTAVTAPDNSVYRPTFNEANLLERVDVNLRGAAGATPFVTDIDCNAKGQRERIEYGDSTNLTFTEYEYDEDTFRLIHLKTTRSTAPANERIVQDLSYTYDPVGNITHIQDDADIQNVIFFRNQRVEPSADYTYDALYRLIQASGREHLGQVGGSPIPQSYNDAPRVGLLHPGDGNIMGRYIESYVYDAVGNILEMQHRGSDPTHPGWTRNYNYKETSLIEDGTGGTLLKKSNRLSRTEIGNGIDFTETYSYVDTQSNDVHGCMTSINSMQMDWDFKGQLQMVGLGGGGTAYYVYDAAGQRVRKVIHRHNGTKQKERIYIGGFESYLEFNGSSEDPDLKRETLHIMDDKRRIALVETRTKGVDDSPEQLIRYQFSNHLGSASLELDDHAQIISYEEYYPYGSTSYQAVRSQTETPKRYRYTAKERDEETGLCYHGARYYAPWLGRWISCDPSGIGGEVTLYCYSLNRPTGLIDPNGREPNAPYVDPFAEEMKLLIGAPMINNEREAAEYAAKRKVAEASYKEREQKAGQYEADRPKRSRVEHGKQVKMDDTWAWAATPPRSQRTPPPFGMSEDYSIAPDPPFCPTSACHQPGILPFGRDHPLPSGGDILVGLYAGTISAVLGGGTANAPGKDVMPGDTVPSLSEGEKIWHSTEFFAAVFAPGAIAKSALGRAARFEGPSEFYYRTMSEAQLENLEASGMLIGGKANYLSPARFYSEALYEGVLVEFRLAPGATEELATIGVRNRARLTQAQYGEMPFESKGWMENNVNFKAEGPQINIGVGTGQGRNKFSELIQGYRVLGHTR